MKNRLFVTAVLIAAIVTAPSSIVAAGSPPPARIAVASQAVSDQDIARFWQAFDAINATTDPAERLDLIQTIYIDPGTAGLHVLMAARRYTAQQYADALVKWPHFWRSVRPLTARSRQAVVSLNDDVAGFSASIPNCAQPR